MRRFTFAACKTLTLFAALALFAVGCASTAGETGGAATESKKAPYGYRYVCNCGPDCKCGSNADKSGNCTCGKPMALKKVLALQEKSYLVCGCADCKCDALDPKDPKKCSCGKPLMAFPRKGAYSCACPGCDCDMQANVPGKCVCGKELKQRQ